MNSLKSRLLLVLAASGLTSFALGQQISPPSPAGTSYSSRELSPPGSTGDNYGLLGQHYAGVNFGYTNLDSGPLSLLHSYGFESNTPVSPNFDAGLKYTYSRGGVFGSHVEEHDAAVSLVGYLPLGAFRPFAEADAGWAWQKFRSSNDNSFFYLLGAGVEFQVAPRWVVSPYIHYQEATHFNDRYWSYGAKTTYWINRGWGATLGADLDEHKNLGYEAGVKYRF